MESQRLIVFVALALVALQSVGVTIHRSFRTREAGFDFGTGRATVAYPVNAKIGQAIDAARQKESAEYLAKLIKGKNVRVEWKERGRRAMAQQKEEVSDAFRRS